MGLTQSKRLPSVCYLRLDDLSSHQLLIALFEKTVETQICFLDGKGERNLADFENASPYQIYPVLKERDFSLYSMPVIMEFLEERYPHPPLLPVYPVLRARARLMTYRIQRDWYPAFEKTNCLERMPSPESLKNVVTGLAQIGAAFQDTPYLGSEEFSILDLAVLPVLWRLSLSRTIWAQVPLSVKRYTERLFARPSMEESVNLLKHQTFLEREIAD